MNVEEEVERLKEEIKRLGDPQQDGSYKVKFGVLFNDDRCANIFEALVGTLRAAKKRKVVAYEGELLLQGVHDKVEIVLLKPT
ncbi:costars family protein WS02710_H03 [Nymphaea colorata]|uniref:costars family protein WS02710_H03 n=1 Tax=Nymphaea colorata TaxID=210225 RepID=UPI00129D9A92|nr:costars family protein WS02710_H03 [Nymphaea colorata]